MKAILHSYKLAHVTFWFCLHTLLLTFTTHAGAEVYRWVDSQGKTHYGDRAPQESRAKTERVDIKVGSGGVDPDAERARQQMRVINEGRERERAFAEQKAAENQERQADLAKRCKSLQNDMRADRETAVFFRYDDQGNRVIWTAEERLAHREKMQTLNDTYCSNSSD